MGSQYKVLVAHVNWYVQDMARLAIIPRQRNIGRTEEHEEEEYWLMIIIWLQWLRWLHHHHNHQQQHYHLEKIITIPTIW